ncbi:MAG: hypothetical protein ACK57B_08435 [Betaproteobacteria bacterium]
MSLQALKRHPRATLALAALAVVGGYAWLIPWHARRGEPVPDWTLALDLLVVLPLLAWWLQPAPRGRGALFSALAVALAGIWVGAWLLPDENKLVWRWLEPLRWAVLGALLVLELLVMVSALRQLATVLRLRRHAAAPGPLEVELHALLAAQAERLGRLTGRPLGAALPWLQMEARMWLYALAPRRWLDTPPTAGEQAFFVHRQGQNLSNQMGFVVLVGVEIPVLHVLLHLWAGPLVAGIATLLGVWGWLFLWAEARATRWRAVGLDAHTLHLRHGLVTDLAVPRAAIVAAGPHRGAMPARAAGRLRCAGQGRANVHLRLRTGTRLATLAGERAVSEIFLGVDEPERLLRALNLPGEPAA